ncbi:MAG: hypothetical protein GX837_06830 [Methanomicrobiales archaeon]|nr:hypothetical protein [Methanomicrobiales archaeon]
MVFLRRVPGDWTALHPLVLACTGLMQRGDVEVAVASPTAGVYLIPPDPLYLAAMYELQPLLLVCTWYFADLLEIKKIRRKEAILRDYIEVFMTFHGGDFILTSRTRLEL